VVFATLLVSANTMAMSIRERTREVAVLKTLGFTRGTVLGLFVGEAVVVAAVAGFFGMLAGIGLMKMFAHSPQAGFFAGISVSPLTMTAALFVAALVGLVSAVVPSLHASRTNIVEGLRYIG
jgi:putative ABC transport system permease protein